MTEQKHLKALIRARMAKTGERYTAARAHVVRMPRPSLRPVADFRAHDQLPIGSRITGVAGHPTDGRMAVATTDAGLRVFDPDGSEAKALTDGSEMALSVAWSGDGSFVVAGTSGGATVWATDSWEAVRSISAGSSGVMPLALAPEGSSIALGWEHHLGLWTADGDGPAELVGDLPKGVYGISYSHDGSRIALAAADGRVRIWQLE